MPFQFYYDQSFATGAVLGATSYFFACKIQRIAARRRPFHFAAATLGTAYFCQAFMCFQNSMREGVLRRQKQFVVERQKSYVGEARDFKDRLYEDLVKDLEKQQQQQQQQQ